MAQQVSQRTLAIADRIIAHHPSVLLPVESAALRYSMKLTLSLLEEAARNRYANIREYYDTLGIQINAPDTAAKGWYVCTLPEHLAVRRIEGSTTEDCTALYNVCANRHIFTIITRKARSDTRCILTSLDFS